MKCSLTIETPQQLEQFKIGYFYGQYEKVEVKASAHEDIFTQLPFFAYTEHQLIVVTDEQGNSVEIEPLQQKVSASFKQGHTALRYLPNDFEDFYVRLEKGATVTADDVNAMAIWSNAKKIVFSYSVDFWPNSEFSDRIKYLKERDHVIISKVNIVQPPVCLFPKCA